PGNINQSESYVSGGIFSRPYPTAVLPVTVE
ncbi:hypothetical protein ACN38_g12144, partial [Penicillium nordicum]